jgi:hypothetical protein
MISFLKQYAEKYSHVKGNIYTAEIPKISNEFLTYEFLPWKKGRSGGRFNTNADKIVFETQDDYVVFDKDEMLEYIRQKEMKEVKFDELLDKVDFKRLLPK